MKPCYRLLQGLRILSIALFVSAAAPSVRAVTVDNFESPTSPAPWIFSNGPEYPGATGSLTRGVGHTGYGAHLAFDLTAGGNYVSATDWLAVPVTANVLQLWVKNPGGVRVQIRVNDSTGQTLQYSPSRPFEASVPANWYALTVELGATSAHWGGSNDGVVHGSITGVSILAQPTLDLVGAIDFDDVILLPSNSTLVNPASSPVATPAVPNFFASLGVEITHADATTTGINLVRSLGFRRVRTEMFWADVETQAGVYNFSWYDQLVASLKQRQIKAHFILCYGNPLYTGTDWFEPPRTPAAIQSFGNFAKAAAAHYAGQGVHFEVWNEPDISTFWNPPSATEYSALSEVAMAQVHAGDPTAAVSSGGLAGIDLAFLDQVIADGGVNAADAIGIHPYRLEIPEQLADDLADLRATVAQAFPNDPPPVWSTEAGYSSAWYGDGTLAANRTTQAKLGIRQIFTGLGLGLPVQIVFALSDAGTNAWNTEDNFGIVDAAYQTKPLTTALNTLSKLGRGHTFAGILASPQSTLHVFKFHSLTDTLLALWTETADAGPQMITFPNAPKQAVDYLGNPVTVTQNGPGSYAVTVLDTPVYVSFAVGGTAASIGQAAD